MDLRVVIVGAGETGTELARRLAPRHRIILLDRRPEPLTGSGAPIRAEELVAERTGPGLIPVLGDGTSRLVLRRLLPPEARSALVAATETDEANLEIARLGQELGFAPVLAVQHGPGSSEAYRATGATVFHRAGLLADSLERSVQHQGAVVPVGIGLGRGELLEIRLQRTSPILGRPLRELDPHRWRVAAVFRGDALLVPAGDTRLQADDRVLLVGDPEVLPTVSEYLRLGKPEFPRPYGPNVVSLELGAPDEALAAEGRELACACGARRFVRGYPGAQDSAPDADEEPFTGEACKGRTGGGTFHLPAADAPDFGERVLGQHPGALLVRARPVRPWQRPRTRRLWRAVCDRFEAPVLFARGRFPYTRILLPILGQAVDLRAAELAIDLARMLEAALTGLQVTLPEALTGKAPGSGEPAAAVQRLCQLFKMPCDLVAREGNPVREILALAGGHGLIVAARRRHQPDSLWRPDVALRVALAAPSSVLVLTTPAGGRA